MNALLTLMSKVYEHPWSAIVIGALLVLVALWQRQRALGVVAFVWLVYAAYEYSMKLKWICTGDCNIRVDLLLIYPVLAAITVMGLIVSAVSVWRRSRARAL